MGSLIQPGGPRRDQVVLRRTRPDLDRMSLDQAQLYLTTPPAGTGGGGVAGPYSVAASGTVTGVSGSTATVSCNAPISKSVTATNYTGRFLNVNDLVYVTGVIDGSTETYSVVTVYQGTGVPSFATPPSGNPAFPRAVTEWGSTNNFTGNELGMVVCRLSDAYPQVLVARAIGSLNTNAQSSFITTSVLWWDTVTSTRGSVSTGVVTPPLDSGTLSGPNIWPYGEGFAVFNGRGRSVYTDAAMYAWNPRASSGLGGWVNINLPTESGYTHRSAGVGADGKIWSATLTVPSNFSSAQISAGGAGPSELKLYRFDTAAGNIYSGSWTLVSTTSLPNYVGSTLATFASEYSVFVTHGGHLLVRALARSTTVSNNVGATARLSGASPTITTYSQNNGLDSTFWGLRYTMNDDSLLSVGASQFGSIVQVTMYDPVGTTTILNTAVPASGVSMRAVFDQNGNIMVYTPVSTGASSWGTALYRVSKTGFSTPVTQSGTSLSSSSGINSSALNNAFGPTRTISGVNPKFLALMPNGSAVIATSPWTSTEWSKYSFYLYEL